MADKINKLSDAIRLGATFRGQCFKEFFQDGKSCAIGAAIEATGVHALELSKRFPALKLNVTHPVNNTPFKTNLFRMITDLNDIHSWPRERIASWLESIGY